MRTTAFALVTLATLLVACTQKAADAPVPPGGPITAPPEHADVVEQPTPIAPAPIPPRVEGPVGDALDAYDGLRTKLAADDLAGAQTFAKALGDAAKTAAEHAVTAKPDFDAIVTSATTIVSTKDIKEARAAFGEASKHVVALLVADPELRTGRFLFLCPMAKGYQKWVQTNEKLANPYFGKEMLECGEEQKAWAV